MYIYIIIKTNDMKNLETMTKAKNLVGTEINEVEYIDHIVMQDSKTYFSIIHLNGSERLVEVSEIVK